MAVLAGYSRHKMFDEMNDPLYSATKGSPTYFLTPSEQRATAQANLGMTVPVATGGSATFRMPEPATATATATLTTAQVLNGLIVATPAAAVNYTLPTAAALDTALPQLAVGDAFEFTIINVSTTAANDITIVTNTGLTMVGELVIEANEATQLLPSQGRFWARKTAAGAWTVYRVGS